MRPRGGAASMSPSARQDEIGHRYGAQPRRIVVTVTISRVRASQNRPPLRLFLLDQLPHLSRGSQYMAAFHLRMQEAIEGGH
jgi:hypothetical protein